MKLCLRTRLPQEENSDPLESVVHWNARETAIIVCDMWDRHWCEEASQRVDELAPFMNEVLVSARRTGIFIVHAPSDTMDHYHDWPQRGRAQHARVARSPMMLARKPEPPLPIDDSDGGCSNAHAKPWRAWSSQHAAIQIEDQDAISDDGDEIHNLFEGLGIRNVLLVGVHTNMCILGRSFGLRRMLEMGKNVALVRDLTDSMYSPDHFPYVSHIEGTQLVIAHIETYVCPSISSRDLTNAPPFRFKEDRSLSEKTWITDS